VIWRRLLSNPANRHESFKLELSGAWESRDSSRALLDGEEKVSPLSVSNGNES
jgi:hypothetical protein